MSHSKGIDQLPRLLPSPLPSRATTLDDLPHNSVLLDILVRAGVWQPGAAAEAQGTQHSSGSNFFTVDGQELYNAGPCSTSTCTRTSNVCAWNVCRLFRQVLQNSPEAVSQLLSEHHGGPCSALTHAAAAGMTQVVACLVHQALGLRAFGIGLMGDAYSMPGFGGHRGVRVPSCVGCARQQAVLECQHRRGGAQGCCCTHHRSRQGMRVECQQCCNPSSLLDLLADQLPQQQQPQQCLCYHCQNQQQHMSPIVPLAPPPSSSPYPPESQEPMLHAPRHSELGSCCQPTLDAPLHPLLHAPLCAASAAGHLPVVQLLLSFSSRPHAPESHLLHLCKTAGAPRCGQSGCVQADGAGGRSGSHAQALVRSLGCQCCLSKSHVISHNRSAAAGFTGSRTGGGVSGSNSSSSHPTEPRSWHPPLDQTQSHSAGAGSSAHSVCSMHSTHRACTQALEGAAQGGHEGVCELLLGCGVRASAAALEGAARVGHEGLCKLLLAHGARVTGEAVAGAVEGAGEWMLEARKSGKGLTEGDGLLFSRWCQTSPLSSSAVATAPAPAAAAAACTATATAAGERLGVRCEGTATPNTRLCVDSTAAGAPATRVSVASCPAGGAAKGKASSPAAAAEGVGGKPREGPALECSSQGGQMTAGGGPARGMYPELECAAGRLCCMLLRVAAGAAAEACGTDSVTLRFEGAPSIMRLGQVQGSRLLLHSGVPVTSPANSMPEPRGACSAAADARAALLLAPGLSDSVPPSGGPCSAAADARAALLANSTLAHQCTYATDTDARAAPPPAAMAAGSAPVKPQGTCAADAGAQAASLLTVVPADSMLSTQFPCSTKLVAPLIPACSLGIDLSNALEAAAKHGLLGLCELLLACSPQRPAGVALDDALCSAAKEGHLAVCKLLLRAGAAAQISEGPLRPNPLVSAAYNGHKEVCALLLAHGAAADAGSNFPLTMAASGGHEEVCALLLEHGARADGDQVCIPLIEAALGGHARVCALLLAHGAKADAGASWPLRAAAKGGHAEVCALMLAHGADARAKNNQALEIALARGHKDVCKLLEHGVHADAKACPRRFA
mmetsp:Transcript_18119/g.50746  ORF Transcript_18119/g.50746 Transcript_18119/m.50746 type:complete len:1072 (+) Transcript_18119:143-3358(+)|eukprot:CAMPEP_0202392736 /NCGR_PEP_ID=MMETSP1127-20130417/92539_1 /ASSEMBLY_ACC=CAM_ASM_000462 /TAXON_ID=3047 /ORGANISM="Dunaliella tertiolecta, Strain CCMP1320" /LENGTH=1071 /DNA_ID=CAMNT_0048995277 /DNA_START=2125 /DNA_END=5340 /DNA_ORIENTATION=-